MNIAKHAAWMMNPNLTEAELMNLIEADFKREEELMAKLCADSVQIAGDMKAAGKSKHEAKMAALNHMGNNLWLVLCS